MLALEPNQGHALALKKEIQKQPRIQNKELEEVNAFCFKIPPDFSGGFFMIKFTDYVF